MPSPLRLAPLACLAPVLLAQGTGDLNSLVLQAGRYADFATAGQASRPVLTLYRIIGGSGDGANPVMRAGVDLQQWTLVYQVEGPPPPAAGEAAQSLSVQCTRGMFNGLQWSQLPVFDARSLQWAWIAVSLDDAIAQLNRLGCTRGFSSLTVMRPLHPRFPDETTFIFKCEADRLFVGISAQTGRKL